MLRWEASPRLVRGVRMTRFLLAYFRDEPLAARVLSRFQIFQFAKRTDRWIEVRRGIWVRFVASVTDRITPAAFEALQFPSVDRQIVIFGLVVVVLANQRTLFATRVLFAFSRRGDDWPGHDLTQFIKDGLSHFGG